jgi:integrase
MALTDAAIRNAKPAARPYKMSDSGGLYLLVSPAGGKLWRQKFRVAGKEKLLALGAYPETSLKDAREGRDEARRLLARGKDPTDEKRREKQARKIGAANTFGAVAKACIEKNRRDGLAEATIRKREWFVSLVEKPLGRRPIAEIAPFEILDAVRPFEAARNDEKAHRTLQFIGQVFRYAVANQLAPSDPTRDLRGALASRKPKHLAAILDARKAGELMRAIDGYEGLPVTKLAMQLSPHVFVRPGELRHAEWSEIDLDEALWIIPAEKMKMRKAHHVPLSRQSVALFRRLHTLTGPAGYAFPSVRTRERPMSENTVNAGLRRLGFSGAEMTAHGFRAMASTLLNESGKWSPDAIERALAHGDSDKVRAAYHRGAHWKERVAMAQWWSDYLDALRKGADVVPLRAREAG